MMRKILVIIAGLLFLAPPCVQAQTVLFYSWGPYSCKSDMAGFNLMIVQQNIYRFSGPLYVPLPGYTAALSDITFNTGAPQNAQATLTLIPPSNIINRYALPRLAVVPPIWIDTTFSTPVPLYQLNVYIANPINRFDRQINCVLTGAIQ